MAPLGFTPHDSDSKPNRVVGAAVSPRDVRPEADAFLRASLEGGRKLIVVSGLVQLGGSPELMRARLRFISETIDLVQSQLPLRVASVQMLPSEELQLIFSESGMAVTFDARGGSIAELFDQVQRLRIIFAEFGNDPAALSSVDLAFRKIAVVKPRAA